MAGSGPRPPVSAGSLGKEFKGSHQETAEYIATLLEALRLTAHQAELSFLSYLISVAQEEANLEKQKSD